MLSLKDFDTLLEQEIPDEIYDGFKPKIQWHMRVLIDDIFGGKKTSRTEKMEIASCFLNFILKTNDPAFSPLASYQEEAIRAYTEYLKSIQPNSLMDVAKIEFSRKMFSPLKTPQNQQERITQSFDRFVLALFRKQYVLALCALRFFDLRKRQSISEEQIFNEFKFIIRAYIVQ